MSACCIILKKKIEEIGKKLMKDFYEHVHDDYFLKEFDEVKLKRKYYDKNLTKEFLAFHKKEEENFQNLYFDDKRYEDLVEMETKDLLSKIETKIKDGSLDFKIIFNFFYKMDERLEIDKNIDFEMDEDLYCFKKAFLNIFKVYHEDYLYLED